METVNLLWSGGWDGTFRFLQLASEPICIQPIYIKDPGRGSQKYEIRAIHEIIDAVKSSRGALRQPFVNLCYMMLTGY